MKKTVTKVLASILAAVTITGMFGCTPKNEEGEKVKIVWAMPGPGKLKDSEAVWAELNKKIQEKIPNVELEFELFAYADYAQKILLMQSGREQLDIVNTAPLNFGDEVRKQSFMDITDLVDENCKELQETLPETSWGFMKKDGRLYGIPSYQGIVTRKGIFMPKDLADKYLDKAALEKALEAEYLTEEFYDVYEDYLENAKANGELRLGFKSGDASIAWKGYETFMDVFCISKNDETCQVKYIYQEPEMKLYYEKMHDWYQKGYIREDMLTAYTDNTQVGKENGYIQWLATHLGEADMIATAQYGFDITGVPLEPHYIPMNNSGAGGNAVTSSCKNPEVALQVLNLINTDKELWRLMVYGFEGQHYKKISETKAETFGYTGNPTSNNDYGMFGWCVGNTFNGFNTNVQDDFLDHLQVLSETVEWKSPLIGFVPDTKGIDDKIAQIKAVKQEYAGLLTGAIEDVEGQYNEYMNKLKLAGVEEVKAELQKQVDEFLKNKN